MSNTPKTIQIFLPNGDPQGIRIAEITTRIVQVIEVPRSLLAEFLAMPESDHVAVYFLFGERDEWDESRVYIGQTGDLRGRLAKHNKEKDFWQRAAVLISRTNSLTQTHALFLEWFCLQEVRKAARYVDENGNKGSKPHTPAPLEADCREIFETGQSLLSTLGHPLFDPVAKSASSTSQADVYLCNAAGCKGRGLLTQEGFVVLKGSIARKELVPSLQGTSGERMRLHLVNSGILRDAGESLVFEKDHLFGSPSTAASMLMGRSANGWSEWRTKDGNTLDSVVRQNVPQ